MSKILTIDDLIDQAAIKLESAMDEAIVFAQSIAPIDTSSYQISIRREGLNGEGLIRTGSIVAGGLDFTGQVLATGKTGNLVDYAQEIEVRDGVLSQSMGVLINEIESWE